MYRDSTITRSNDDSCHVPVEKLDSTLLWLLWFETGFSFYYSIRKQCDNIYTQKRIHKKETCIDCPFIDSNILFIILSPRLGRTRTVCSSFCSSWDSFPWLPTGFWTCLPLLSTSPSPPSSAQSSLVSTHGSPDWQLVRVTTHAFIIPCVMYSGSSTLNQNNTDHFPFLGPPPHIDNNTKRKRI